MCSDLDPTTSATMDGTDFNIVGHRYDKGELTLKTEYYRKWKADVASTKFPILPIRQQYMRVLSIGAGSLLGVTTLAGLIGGYIAFLARIQQWEIWWTFPLLFIVVATYVVLWYSAYHVKGFIDGEGSSILGEKLCYVAAPEYMQKAWTEHGTLVVTGRGKHTGRRRRVMCPDIPTSTLGHQKDDIIEWTREAWETVESPKAETEVNLTHVISVEPVVWVTIGDDDFIRPTFYLSVTKDVHDRIRRGDRIVRWQYTPPKDCAGMEHLFGWLNSDERTVTFKWAVVCPKRCESKGPKEEARPAEPCLYTKRAPPTNEATFASGK